MICYSDPRAQLECCVYCDALQIHVPSRGNDDLSGPGLSLASGVGRGMRMNGPVRYCMGWAEGGGGGLVGGVGSGR